MRLLIAESDTALREILQASLSNRGYAVEIADDGLSCIAQMRDFLPDVVVLDRELLWGGSDGVLSWIREDVNLQEIPVILIARDERTEEFIELVHPPIVSWLRKPFLFCDLLARIKAAGRLTRIDNTQYRGVSKA